MLGSSCAKIELAPDNAVDPDDKREMFVAAWCAHPDLIPDEKIVVIPEPVMHDGRPPLFLREEEMTHSDLPTLRYRVRTSLSSRSGIPHLRLRPATTAATQT